MELRPEVKTAINRVIDADAPSQVRRTVRTGANDLADTANLTIRQLADREARFLSIFVRGL